MKKIFFGWIDKNLKELGFLKEMSASASKLYVFFALADGRSSYSTKAIEHATGLSNVTIYKARRELKRSGLITTQREMTLGRKNKKPSITVELQDLPFRKRG